MSDYFYFGRVPDGVAKPDSGSLGSLPIEDRRALGTLPGLQSSFYRRCRTWAQSRTE